MRDATGHAQTAVLLGGTSEIGLAVLRRLVRPHGGRVVLAARDVERASEAAAALPAEAEVVAWDADRPDDHDAVVEQVVGALGDVDLVVVAVGLLADTPEVRAEPDLARRMAVTNYAGAVSMLERLAAVLRRQGHGLVVVMSSVAGERVRASNYAYGASKAALDGYAQGLGDALADDGVEVCVVRPGFVTGRMTEGRDAPPLSTTPEAVAAAVERAVARRRRTVWVPAAFRWVMLALRLLPRPLFRRLPF